MVLLLLLLVLVLLLMLLLQITDVCKLLLIQCNIVLLQHDSKKKRKTKEEHEKKEQNSYLKLDIAFPFRMIRTSIFHLIQSFGSFHIYENQYSFFLLFSVRRFVFSLRFFCVFFTVHLWSIFKKKKIEWKAIEEKKINIFSFFGKEHRRWVSFMTFQILLFHYSR